MQAILMDVYGKVVVENGYGGTTVSDGTEGTVVDVSGYNGTIIARLRVIEAASTPVDDKLDITVHNVISDSDAPDSDNKIGSFTQIVGVNGSETDHEEDIAINLNALPVMTTAEKATATAAGVKPVKKYLQILIGNTHSWADTTSMVVVDFLCAGERTLPAQAL